MNIYHFSFNSFFCRSFDYAQDDRDGMKTILSAMLLALTDPSLRSG